MRSVSSTTFGFATVLGALLAGAPRLGAQNVLLNPDLNVDVAGWRDESGTVDWTSEDADDCAGSGALLGASGYEDPHQRLDIYSTCFAVVPGEDYTISMEYRGDAPSVEMTADFFLDASCKGLADFRAATGGGPVATFTRLEYSDTVPANVTAALFTILGSANNTTTPFTVVADRAYFGALVPIFLDDFEAGATCRWDLALKR